jgi:hypothetical protein
VTSGTAVGPCRSVATLRASESWLLRRNSRPSSRVPGTASRTDSIDRVMRGSAAAARRHAASTACRSAGLRRAAAAASSPPRTTSSPVSPVSRGPRRGARGRRRRCARRWRRGARRPRLRPAVVRRRRRPDGPRPGPCGGPEQACAGDDAEQVQPDLPRRGLSPAVAVEAVGEQDGSGDQQQAEHDRSADEQRHHREGDRGDGGDRDGHLPRRGGGILDLLPAARRSDPGVGGVVQPPGGGSGVGLAQLAGLLRHAPRRLQA